MKTISILLITALALPAFAGKKTYTIEVDEAVSQESIHLNFDGSITIIEPRLSVDGKKVKIYSQDRGLEAVKIAQFHPQIQKIIEEQHKSTLVYDDAQSIIGACKMYGKSLVIKASFGNSFWGTEKRVVLNEDAQLDSMHEATEERKAGSWISSLTCR